MEVLAIILSPFIIYEPRIRIIGFLKYKYILFVDTMKMFLYKKQVKTGSKVELWDSPIYK